jgi:uroporphyrinogen decarboxylase
MGLTYEMVEKKGPHFPKTIRSANDISGLRIAPPESLQYVYDAISITKRELNGRVPLIGFAGAPWTLLSYMVEGGGSKTFSKARGMLYQQPELAHQVLDMVTQSTIGYLKAQIKAGADIIQIFDSWAGVLGPDQYREFSLKYISQICDAITEVPVTVFAKGAWFAFEDMASLNCRTIGLDWCSDAKKIRHLMPNKTLQGNLDPCALYGSFAEIRTATKTMLDSFGDHPHIANLGHGVYPDTDPEKVKCFVESVKEYSA